MPADNESKTNQILDEPEALIIKDALDSKESSDKLIEFAELHSSAIFAKCILARTKKSLEYLKKTIDIYRKVFDHCFTGSNQAILLEQVMVVYEHEQDKCLKTVQKLSQINVLSTQQIVSFAAKRLHDA